MAFKATFLGIAKKTGHWASGDGVVGASMSLHPSLESLEQDQQTAANSCRALPHVRPFSPNYLPPEVLYLREAKQLAQGHTAGRQSGPHQNPGLSVQLLSLRQPPKA